LTILMVKNLLEASEVILTCHLSSLKTQ